MENNEEIIKSCSYDNAKVITTLLVVIGHTLRMYTTQGLVQPIVGSLVFAKGAELIYSFHMPLYFLLSGGVYRYCVSQGKYKDSYAFAGQKARRLLIPYLVVGAVYVSPIMCALHFTQQSFFEYFFLGILLSQNSRHLWYLLALFWIFMWIIPWRNKLERIPWSLLLTSGILLVASLFMPGCVQINSAMYYQWFFLLGILADMHFDRIQAILKNKQIQIVFGILCILMPVFLGFKLPLPSVVLKVLRETLGALGVFLGITLLIHDGFQKSGVYRIIKRHSFGIYLFHPMIIYVIFYVFQRLMISPLVISSLSVLTSILLSIVLTKALRSFRLGWILGE